MDEKNKILCGEELRNLNQNINFICDNWKHFTISELSQITKLSNFSISRIAIKLRKQGYKLDNKSLSKRPVDKPFAKTF